MVARDPIRKRTLSAHPEFDGKKEGADRWSDPHVGSTVNAEDHKPVPETEPVAGKSSADAPAKPSKKG